MKEQITNASLKGVIVILSIFIIWVIVSDSKKTYDTNHYYGKMIDSLKSSNDTLKNLSDSVVQENFMLETEINRYRIALEMLESEDYKCASEFDKRLSMTE